MNVCRSPTPDEVVPTDYATIWREGIEMNNRNFLTVEGLGPETLYQLVKRALVLNSPEGSLSQPLKGKYVGVYFRKSSTRTRTSFTVAASRLGSEVIQYGPTDLQLTTGESALDTGRVLSQFLDTLVVRTNQSLAEMRDFAAQGRMSVINAMSENEHPTQAIADLVTIYEALGRLDGVHILYMGEGNNTAAALALATTQIPGMRLTVVSPKGYGLPDDVLDTCRNSARRYGTEIEAHHSMDDLPKGVDVVYTTRWQTMGQPKADINWREKFKPYGVTCEVMARVSKPAGTIFLHDLPAVRNAEVVDEVLDGPQSYAFRQAHHKLSGAMAILEWCGEARADEVGLTTSRAISSPSLHG